LNGLSRRLDRVALKIDPPLGKGAAFIKLLKANNALDVGTLEGAKRHAEAVDNWLRACTHLQY